MTPEQREKFLQRPALVIPGIEGNFDDPWNFSHGLITNVLTLLVLSSTVVLVRMYTKVIIVGKVFLEDYLLVVSWLIYAIPYTFLAFKCATLPFAVHQYDMKMDRLIETLYWYSWGAGLYGPIILPLKLSIGLQCLRVFVVPGQRTFEFWASHTMIWSHTAFYIVETILALFLCTPRARIWDKSIPGTCYVGYEAFNLCTSVVNIVSDILMLLVPQKVIWGFRMPRRQRLGFSVVFLVTVLACAAAMVRLYYAIQLVRDLDKTYNIAMIGLWGFPEMAAGYLVACIPVVPRFLSAVGKTSLFMRMGKGFRLHFRKSNLESVARHVNGSGNTDRKNSQRWPGSDQIGVITDLEFQELAVEDRSDSSMRSQAAGGNCDDSIGGGKKPEVQCAG